MKFLKMTIKCLQPLLVTTLISACAVVPKNLDNLGQDDGSHFSRQIVVGPETAIADRVGRDNVIEHESHLFYETRLVRGDVLRLAIAGMTQYDGLYQVTTEGNLDLPFIERFTVAGLSRQELIDKLEAELVRLRWFYSESVKVELSVVQLASINVSVMGAVFNPGRATINSEPIMKPATAIQNESGAFSAKRDLVSALVAAGGLRPDADISKVYVKRGKTILWAPLTGVLNGDGFTDTPNLINGDQIIVRSTGQVDSSLIKPTQVTPPGMRVFMSNLTAPALNNSQSAVGADSTRLPYGSSLLDSAISANCIGGTHQANASRSVVLVTRNFGSNQQLVVRRSINQLLANSSDHSVNPFVMPNDGIACYDSRFTNFRDVARGVGEVISPILLGRLL